MTDAPSSAACSGFALIRRGESDPAVSLDYEQAADNLRRPPEMVGGSEEGAGAADAAFAAGALFGALF